MNVRRSTTANNQSVGIRVPVVQPWIVAVSVMLLAGCANVTFKPGASGEAMGADERACRASSTTDADYAQCMRSRGSYVVGGGSESTPTPKIDRPAATPALGKPERSAGTPAAATGTTPAAAIPAAASAPNAAVAPPPSPAVTPPPAAEAEPTAAAEPVDPLEKTAVGSWWSIGGTTSDLDRAIAACVKKLGDAHRPNSGATVVTVGLRDCLREAGWRAVKAVP